MWARPLAVGLALLLFGWGRQEPEGFHWFTYSLGFAHYGLALGYARRQIGETLDTLPRFLGLSGLLLLSGLLTDLDFPLAVLFGLHHAANETYLPRPGHSSPSGRFLAAAFLFHLTAYAVVLRGDPLLGPLDPNLSGAALAGAGTWLAAEILRQRGSGRSWRPFAPEMTSTALLALSLFLPVSFLEYVLFHFVLWAVLPLGPLQARGAGARLRYGVASVGLTAGFLALSPLGPATTSLGYTLFTRLFLFGSYAHILLSMALSEAHPGWLVRTFRPRPAPGS